MNELINDEAIYRTAPTTPVLLSNVYLSEHLCSFKKIIQSADPVIQVSA